LYLGKKKEKKPWWLPNYYFTPQEKQPGEVNNYKYGVFSVSRCPECEHAWEYGVVGKRRVPIYHEDFPTYKLKEKICPQCEGKNETD